MTVQEMTDLIQQAQLDEAQRAARVRSKIYGYDFDASGAIIIVEPEAEVIRGIFNELCLIEFMSASRILDEIAKDFRKASPQIRNRSGRLFLPANLAKLAANPVYASLELDSWGRYVKISNYPPIVSDLQYKKAIKRLKREGLA